MDDIFQILIYVFIIVSFLVSLFKKKQKPESNKNESPYKPSPQPKIETKSSQQEEYDILKEIEKMFKTDVPLPEKQKETTFERGEEFEVSAEHIKTDEWHQPTEREHKATTSEHIAENWDEKRKKTEASRKSVNEKIIRQAEAFEKNLSEKSYQRGDSKNTLIEKLKHPQALKDYIIISEILGNPKALQE